MTALREHILIIRHGAFGDIVQTDGAFRDIRAHHAQATITLLTTPPFVKLMQRCPHVDRVISDERVALWRIGRMLSLRRSLQAARFDKVYDLQTSDRTELYHRLLLRGVPWCGRRHRTLPLLGRHILPRPGLARFVDQLQAEGIPTTHTLKPDVSWMVEDVSPILEKAGVTKPYIALIAGSSAQHPHKRWPYYAELASKLIDLGYDIVTAPGPDEIGLCQTIPGVTLLKPDGVLDWFELAGVLSGATFVVGNDTGPSHIASCLNRPGLALFGSHTSIERTGIKRGRFDAIEVSDLNDLSPDRVLNEVRQRLADHAYSA